MSAPPAILCAWDGEAFAPTDQRWAKIADKHFVVGQVYPLEVREARSHASHSHYFACVHDAWANLREDIAERFPTPEHLRKYALVRAGFRDERSITCASKAEAQRLCAFVRPMDDFAIVTVHEATVTVYTAKSQSLRAMGKADFQRSKDAVLEVLGQMIGTDAATLKDNATEAA